MESSDDKINGRVAADDARTRLLRFDARTLSDEELLAMVLYPGGGDPKRVRRARELLRDFGGLRDLLCADRHRLLRVDAVGVCGYARLRAMSELNRRYLRATLKQGEALSNPKLARDYVKACLRDRSREIFMCLFLDNKHSLLGSAELFQGTLDGACIYPREVVRACLQHNAAAVIFAHNHPSGVADPSRADKRITSRLRDALATVDIRVLDHFVVGAEEVASFAEKGLL